MAAVLVLMFLVADGGPAWNPTTIAGCENVFVMGDRVISGGQPEGEESFKALADRGVKTIVTVDGARPDVDLAKKYGMRYIHLPVEYSHVERVRMIELGHVVKQAEGPVYFHCHHGKHRGPTAVALGMEAAGLWDAATAEKFLKTAGTAEKYQGLYKNVREFTPITPAEWAVPVSLPEVVDVPPLNQAMVKLDHHVEALDAAQKNEWKMPPDHPDVVPVHEALQLFELFAELQRAEEGSAKPDIEYLTFSRVATETAKQLEAELRAGRLTELDAALAAVKKSCNDCHAIFRDVVKK